MSNTDPDHFEERGEMERDGLDVPRSFGDEWISEMEARYEAERDGWWAS